MGTPQAGSLFLQACVDCLDDDNQPQQFDTTALRGLTDITAEHGRITCRLPVSPAVRNRYGTLHGGCIGAPAAAAAAVPPPPPPSRRKPCCTASPAPVWTAWALPLLCRSTSVTPPPPPGSHAGGHCRHRRPGDHEPPQRREPQHQHRLPEPNAGWRRCGC